MNAPATAQTIDLSSGQDSSCGELVLAGQSLPTNNQSGVVTPMHLLQVAMSQGADLAKLEKFMDLHLKWEQAQAKKSFDAAMARFKENVPRIIKDRRARFDTRTGGTTEYTYATLGVVCDAIIEALAQQGLSHRWKPAQDQSGKITVTCILTHKDGYSDDSTQLSAGADTSGSKNNIQAIGSAVTYLERYTLLAATGMAVNEDDDGAGSSERKPDPLPQKPAAAETPKGGPPSYPQERFEMNFTAWRDLIRSGKKTPEQIIAMVSSKGVLSDEQMAKIKEVGK